VFVGREGELARIGERLVDPAVRLLTLVGPGGIGKTRLALRAARQVQARFSGGAVFVDLSAARDTGGVIGAIGRAIGLADSTEELQLRELTARLAGREILLVLDNFEQVAASAPTLAQLIEECPALHLLVTSREALRVRGEHVFPVPTMTMPSRLSERASGRDWVSARTATVPIAASAVPCNQARPQFTASPQPASRPRPSDPRRSRPAPRAPAPAAPR